MDHQTQPVHQERLAFKEELVHRELLALLVYKALKV